MNDTENKQPTITLVETALRDDAPMPALLHGLIAAFEKHIDMLVETRFAALVESHKTLALMDDNMKTAITELIDEAITTHEAENEHWTEDAISRNIEGHVDHYVRHSNDFVSERRVEEILRDTMSEEMDEIIERKLDNATLSIVL